MSLVCAFGQPLNSSEQDKALGLLRQKIAEERSHSVSTPQTTALPIRSTSLTDAEQAALKTVRETIARERQKSQVTAVEAKPVQAVPKPAAPVKSGSPVVGIPSEPGDPNAVRAVRQALAAQRAASAASVRQQPAQALEPAKAAPAPKASQPVVAARTQPAQATVPAEVKPASGPRSKEQRLSHLLELYKADRVSPVEYHEQRAEIIAEP